MGNSKKPGSALGSSKHEEVKEHDERSSAYEGSGDFSEEAVMGEENAGEHSQDNSSSPNYQSAIRPPAKPSAR